MRKIQLFVGAVVMLFAFACSLDDEPTPGSTGIGDLAFSSDTLSFDTLLTSRSSITQRFRVFNRSGRDLLIDEIALAGGNSSFYEIIVNGKDGPTVRDEPLEEGDSLLVLVRANIDPTDENLPFLVKDSVVVSWGQEQTDVKLEAWGQNANFLRGEILCDQTWTNEKPYVIQGFVAVDTLCTLTMMPGTKVYVDNGASIFVQGRLLVQGDSSDQVVFRNTRFDEPFIRAPGQWTGLVFLPGSRKNVISYATIENAVNGIFTFGTNIDAARVQLEVDHSTIRHMSVAGIQAFTSEIQVSNSQIYDCGGYMVANFVGGDYSYDHCTFTNEQTSFIRDEPSMVFLDNFPPSDDPLVADLSLSISHSILWGVEPEELFIGNEGGALIDTTIRENIIRSETGWPNNFTSVDFNFPGFIDPFAFDYQLDSLAFARDKAAGSPIPDDLLGIPRDEIPDIGAFERVDQ